MAKYLDSAGVQYLWSKIKTLVGDSFAANDAMRFKGTLGTGGTVTALPATHTVGDTYKVITAGTYAGATCEVGDMIICIADGTAANNAHWTVVQANIDGSVTASSNLTSNAVVLGAGTKTVKTLANGSNDQVLKIVNGVPAWGTDNNTDTKVTSAANHYTPSATNYEATTETITPGTTNIVTSFTKDSKGHVVGVKMGTLPTYPTQAKSTGANIIVAATDESGVSNTTTEVTASADAPILLGQVVDGVRQSGNVAIIPSDGIEIKATNGTITIKNTKPNVNATIDSSLSSTSINPVQNKVVKTALDGKQATLSFDDTYNSSSNKVATVSSITSRINNLDVAEVGGDGKYIKAISEADGKITATVENLKTGLVTGETSTAAPTSKAVVDYVSTKLGEVQEAMHEADHALNSEIQTISETLANKVDKVSGKGLSTNDFTAALKTKLDGISDSADAVSFAQTLQSGTEVGKITINGAATTLYAPKNTDTHYEVSVAAATNTTSTTSNSLSSSTTKGNYLNIVENNTVRSSIELTTSTLLNAPEVAQVANGQISVTIPVDEALTNGDIDAAIAAAN